MSAESVSEAIGEVPDGMTLDRAWYWKCTACGESAVPFGNPAHAGASARHHREKDCGEDPADLECPSHPGKFGDH